MSAAADGRAAPEADGERIEVIFRRNRIDYAFALTRPGALSLFRQLGNFLGFHDEPDDPAAPPDAPPSPAPAGAPAMAEAAS